MGKHVQAIEKMLENQPCHPYGVCGPYLFCAKVAPESARGKVRDFLAFFTKETRTTFYFFAALRLPFAGKNCDPDSVSGRRKTSSKAQPNREVPTRKCPPGAGECDGEDICTFRQLSARVRRKERKILFLQKGAPLGKRLSKGGRRSECRGSLGARALAPRLSSSRSAFGARCARAARAPLGLFVFYFIFHIFYLILRTFIRRPAAAGF
jgi:hypothetical protein